MIDKVREKTLDATHQDEMLENCSLHIVLCHEDVVFLVETDENRCGSCIEREKEEESDWENDEPEEPEIWAQGALRSEKEGGEGDERREDYSDEEGRSDTGVGRAVGEGSVDVETVEEEPGEWGTRSEGEHGIADRAVGLVNGCLVDKEEIEDVDGKEDDEADAD